MMSVLQQFRDHEARPVRASFFKTFLLNAVVAGLLTVSTWNAAVDWVDHAASVPVPCRLESLTRGSDGKNRTRIYNFGITQFTVVERPQRSAAWLSGLFGADAPEVKDLAVGDVATLWLLPIRNRLTPAPRMPLATTAVALLYLGLLLLLGRPPAEERELPRGIVRTLKDGSTEVRQDRHRCLYCSFFQALLLAPLFAVLMLMTVGVFVPFFGGEIVLREGLAMVAAIVFLTPVFALLSAVEPGPSVRWNDSTLWIHGVKFSRSALRRIVLRPLNGSAVLDVHHDGSRRRRPFAKEALWMAGVLEQQGYDVEFQAQHETPLRR